MLPNGCSRTCARCAEAQAVALLGCGEALLPSWWSLASPDPERLAEERRLFYVAANRAKDRLLITHIAEPERRPSGGPSRFFRGGVVQAEQQSAGVRTKARSSAAAPDSS